MESIASSERAALCNLFDEVGPDAPTLCEGWTTSDLAAHLYVRERRPDAAPGVVLKPLAGYTDKTMKAVTKRLGYAGVVQKIRSGPPFPLRLVNGPLNTLEFFVHHEDVRRASEGWEPREDARLDSMLFGALRRGSFMLARSVKGAGLVLARPSGATIVARRGEPHATVTGLPQELALYMYGRAKVARVTIEADEAARGSLERASFSV